MCLGYIAYGLEDNPAVPGQTMASDSNDVRPAERVAFVPYILISSGTRERCVQRAWGNHDGPTQGQTRLGQVS